MRLIISILTGELFNLLRTRIMNLGSSVREQCRKQYIGYDTVTNFVGLIPLKTYLQVIINIKFTDINDPDEMCRDISNIGHWANGEVECRLENPSQITYLMMLIRQSFEFHAEQVEA